MTSHTSRRPPIVAALFLSALLLPISIHASEEYRVSARASGQVVSAVPCGGTLVCQQTVVRGTATSLGQFEAVLTDLIDLATGTFTGTGVFTFGSGAITTEYAGVVAPDGMGGLVFSETHHVTGGTGRFTGSTGVIQVSGEVNAAGQLSVTALGTLTK